jgi:hypothetical protein
MVYKATTQIERVSEFEERLKKTLDTLDFEVHLQNIMVCVAQSHQYLAGLLAAGWGCNSISTGLIPSSSERLFGTKPEMDRRGG